jgi:PAS domain S-box-containing protein
MDIPRLEPRAQPGTDDDVAKAVWQACISAPEELASQQATQLRVQLAQTGALVAQGSEALHPGRQYERYLSTVSDALPVLISYVDFSLRYRFVNAAYERWFGWSRQEILGKTMLEVLGEAACTSLAPHVRSALQGRQVSYQASVTYRQGTQRHIEATYVPHVSQTGQVLGFTALVADISERKRWEHAREAATSRNARLMQITAALADAVTQEQVYAAVVDQVATALRASSAGLFLLDSAGTHVYLKRSVGYSEKGIAALQVLRLDAAPSIPPIDVIRSEKPLWFASQAQLLRQYPHLADMSGDTPDYQAACLPLSAQGKNLGAIGFSFCDEPRLDTEQRALLLLVARYSSQALSRLHALEAEQQSRALAEASADALRKSLRFNELLTGILGHDLRTPLSAIMLSAQLAASSSAPGGQQPLKRILTSGARMARMIDQLLDLTRAGVGGGIALERRACDLCGLLRQLIDELDDAHPGCELRLTISGDARGQWDQDRLSQVFSNLVANAAQHGSDASGVDIRVIGDDPLEVRVEVHNQGGIAAELLPRIFEPLVSSEARRAKSQGLGLGLYISQQIAVAHQGEIEVRSSEAEGTTFIVKLPRSLTAG